MTAIPVGALVDYHGGITHMHGRYEVVGHSDMEARAMQVGLTSEEMDLHYPDGVGYELWPVGVEKRFGNRDQSLHFVRPVSVTEVSDGVNG